MLGLRGEEGHWFRPWWEAVNRAASLALAITSKTEPVADQRPGSVNPSLTAGLAWIVGGSIATSRCKKIAIPESNDNNTEISAPLPLTKSETGPFYVFILTVCSLAFTQCYMR